MNDEGKEREELLKHFNEITKECRQHCEWTAATYWAVEKICELIQQKPEIDDMKKYVEKKAREILDISTEYSVKSAHYWKELKLVKNCITQIVGDVQGKK